MKNYIIKIVIFFAILFFFFEATIGKRLDKFENAINSIKNAEQRIQLKEKIKFELKKGIEKESYFDDEEKYLISTFLKKIANELSLNN